jgi:phosphoglycolate phosphatase
MSKKFVLFDFDGVIANSFEVGFEVNKSVYPGLSENDYRSAFDGNINDWKESMARRNLNGHRGADSASEYATKLNSSVHIMPGIREVIVALGKEYALAVISSTLSHAIETFLAAHDLAGHFAWVMGTDVDRSKTQKIKMIFEKYGVTANDCVFITDTLGDIREAEAADVGTIAVTWGFQTAETLREGSPFRLVDSPDDILTAVAEYFAQIQ